MGRERGGVPERKRSKEQGVQVVAHQWLVGKIGEQINLTMKKIMINACAVIITLNN